MAKTRLSNERRRVMREFIEGLMTRMIRADLKLDRAEEAMRSVVIKRIQEEFPEGDMAILNRYGLSHSVPKEVTLIYDNQRDMIRSFPLGETELLQPDGTGWGWKVNVTGRTAQAWFDKSAQFKKLFDDKMKDYRSLLLTVNTYEDAVELCPALESLRKRITGNTTSLVALNDAVKVRIWDDQKRMVKLAEETVKAAQVEDAA